jgi:hypothetical protein
MEKKMQYFHEVKKDIEIKFVSLKEELVFVWKISRKELGFPSDIKFEASTLISQQD